jgi:hypothetical protein
LYNIGRVKQAFRVDERLEKKRRFKRKARQGFFAKVAEHYLFAPFVSCSFASFAFKSSIPPSTTRARAANDGKGRSKNVRPALSVSTSCDYRL